MPFSLSSRYISHHHYHHCGVPSSNWSLKVSRRYPSRPWAVHFNDPKKATFLFTLLDISSSYTWLAPTIWRWISTISWISSTILTSRRLVVGYKCLSLELTCHTHIAGWTKRSISWHGAAKEMTYLGRISLTNFKIRLHYNFYVY